MEDLYWINQKIARIKSFLDDIDKLSNLRKARLATKFKNEVNQLLISIGDRPQLIDIFSHELLLYNNKLNKITADIDKVDFDKIEEAIKHEPPPPKKLRTDEKPVENVTKDEDDNKDDSEEDSEDDNKDDSKNESEEESEEDSEDVDMMKDDDADKLNWIKRPRYSDNYQHFSVSWDDAIKEIEATLKADAEKDSNDKVVNEGHVNISGNAAEVVTHENVANNKDDNKDDSESESDGDIEDNDEGDLAYILDLLGYRI